MAQVKFFRGNKVNYSQTNHADGIFFALDTHEVILNNVAYGFSATDAAILAKLNEHAISNVEIVMIPATESTPATPAIKVTCNQSGTEHEHVLALPLVSATANGLMTPALKKQIEDNAAAIETINENLGEGGSVAQQITNAINALDVDLVGAAGEVVTSIKQVDGKIVATAAKVDAANVTYTPDGGEATTVADTLDEISATISTNADDAKVTVDTPADDTVLKKYIIKQGGKEVTTINIPKDLVVSSGSVVTISAEEATETLIAGDKYIKLIIANQEAPLYIPVKELVDVYTDGNGINIGSDNVVSIELDAASESFLTVGASGLKLSGVQAAINTAKSEVNTTVSNVVTSVGLKADGTLKAEFAGDYTTGAADVIEAIDAVETQVKANADAIDVLNGTGAGSVDKKINDALTPVKAYTVNSKAISTNPILGGADIVLTGYTAPTGGVVAATDTVNTAIQALDNALVWHEA